MGNEELGRERHVHRDRDLEEWLFKLEEVFVHTVVGELRRIERRLARIEAGLGIVIEGERIIMADQAALDAAIESLGTAVDALVAKLENIPEVDFSSEIASLNAATQEINDALSPPADGGDGGDTPPDSGGGDEPAPAPDEPQV